jgi:histidine triad (HIT) family protein
LSFDDYCIFCRIVHKQAPASIIYENKTVLSFLDIRPLNIGHTLVIPKSHNIDIFDIPEKELAKIYKISKQISIAVKKATNADGISLIQQNGKAAGQDIFHLHVHVIPRFEGQKLPSFSELKEVDRGKLENMAETIKKQL